MSSYVEGQVHQFVNALEKAGYESGDLTRLGQDQELLKKIRGVLRGGFEICEVSPIIRVNRSIKPTYPDWVQEVLHPELESTGPADYNISDVEQWLHDSQKNGSGGKGQVIYDHLKANTMLPSCLGLRDLEEIRKKGIVFFRNHFRSKAVFGWKSVVQNRSDELIVPYLCENGDEVALCWLWLGVGWDNSFPALRFAGSALTTGSGH